MDFNKVGDYPLGTNYGTIWQGGACDATIATLPGPLVIVTLDAGELDESFIDHKNVVAELYIGIDDSPSAVLPQDQLLAHLNVALWYLEHEFNLYIHCAAGISRSSYFNCGLHMLAKGIDFDTALTYVRKYRPQANPNSGFTDQLKNLKF